MLPATLSHSEATISRTGSPETAQIPVTMLTDYGKTTLLNRVLSESHGKKYAVIINEFGELGVDNDLVIDADEEVFEMNNECICGTVCGELISPQPRRRFEACVAD
jgi:CobW/HypB/UreG, nucleotide-binding domain